MRRETQTTNTRNWLPEKNQVPALLPNPGALAKSLTPTLHWTGPCFYPSFPVVPNASTKTGQDQPSKAGDLRFEEALKKLESIVEAMESEDLPLETLLAKYEEGTQLAKICQQKLAEAELKIQQLEKNAAGEMKLKPLSPALSEAE